MNKIVKNRYFWVIYDNRAYYTSVHGFCGDYVKNDRCERVEFYDKDSAQNYIDKHNLGFCSIKKVEQTILENEFE